MLMYQWTGYTLEHDKATELLGNLYKDVKYREREVSYHAIVSTDAATVEVYINGYPIHQKSCSRAVRKNRR